jgi:hypothetical protein
VVVIQKQKNKGGRFVTVTKYGEYWSKRGFSNEVNGLLGLEVARKERRPPPFIAHEWPGLNHV